jgi:hypothetical protein
VRQDALELSDDSRQGGKCAAVRLGFPPGFVGLQGAVQRPGPAVQHASWRHVGTLLIALVPPAGVERILVSSRNVHVVRPVSSGGAVNVREAPVGALQPADHSHQGVKPAAARTTLSGPPVNFQRAARELCARGGSTGGPLRGKL